MGTEGLPLPLLRKSEMMGGGGLGYGIFWLPECEQFHHNWSEAAQGLRDIAHRFS